MARRRFLLATFGIFAATTAPLPAQALEPQRVLAAIQPWFEPAADGFVTRGANGSAIIRPGGLFLYSGRDSLAIGFSGSRPVLPQAEAPLPSQSAYWVGNDRTNWRSGVPHFATLRARLIYPGIDIVYYFSGRQLEFDFVVSPGADPSRIRLRFEGSPRPRLDAKGNLVFSNGIRQDKPVAYQETAGGRKPIQARYKITRQGEVQLALGPWDSSLPLVIDPILHAGYLGGDRNEAAMAVTIDNLGNVWLAGSSASQEGFPLPAPALQEKATGGRDIFLAKMVPDASGNLNLAYWTQLGGSGDEEATAIAADNQGFVYLAGWTASADLPRAGVPVQAAFGGERDAFVAKIRPDFGPEGLFYSQWFGGNKTDAATSLALDATGAIHVAGNTNSDSLPGAEASGLQCCNRGGLESFYAKIQPDTAAPLAFSTFLGGSRTDFIQALAVDAAGDVYLAGYTASDDFPVTVDALQSVQAGFDLFLAKLNLRQSGLNVLEYATYLGGSSLDAARAMLLDRDGQLWIAGYTLSEDFPITENAYQTKLAGNADGFLLRFDPARRSSPSAITYGTFLGGRDTDVIYSLAFGPGGTLALAGYTFSTDYPLVGSSPARSVSTGADAFVSLIDPARSGAQALLYSDVVIGSLADIATGVAVDRAGNLYLSGYTHSFDLAVTDSSRKQSPGGAAQSFVVKASRPSN